MHACAHVPVRDAASPRKPDALTGGLYERGIESVSHQVKALRTVDVVHRLYQRLVGLAAICGVVDLDTDGLCLAIGRSALSAPSDGMGFALCCGGVDYRTLAFVQRISVFDWVRSLGHLGDR